MRSEKKSTAAGNKKRKTAAGTSSPENNLAKKEVKCEGMKPAAQERTTDSGPTGSGHENRRQVETSFVETSELIQAPAASRTLSSSQITKNDERDSLVNSNGDAVKKQKLQEEISKLLTEYGEDEVDIAVAEGKKLKEVNVEHKVVSSGSMSVLSVNIDQQKVFFGDTEILLPGSPDESYLTHLLVRVRNSKLVTRDNLIDEKELVKLVKEAIGETGDSGFVWRAERVARIANLPLKNLTAATNCGEMFLQQSVYSPIAELFSCFDHSKYCADKKVQTAHVVGCKTNDQVLYQVSCKPDAALRLTEEFYIGAMMEIKEFNADNKSKLHDEYKVILMTCMSILALEKYLMKWNRLFVQVGDDDESKEMDSVATDLESIPIHDIKTLMLGNNVKYVYGDIAIPFVLAIHNKATLYVTQVSGPDTCPTILQLLDIPFTNESQHDAKLKSFFIAMLAILVSDIFKISRNLPGIDKFLSSIFRQNARTVLKNAISDKLPNSKPPNATASGSQPHQESKGSNQNAANPSNLENAAMQVASCNGQLQKLTYPFPRLGSLVFDDDVGQLSADMMFYQQESPFYFKGLYHSYPVFCKVWHEGDLRSDRTNIRREVEFHCKANEYDVPSSKVVQELTSMDVFYHGISSDKSSFSTVYHVLVTEYYEQDDVDEQDILNFALSLVQAVVKLHSIGVLHCDIKPSNILWDAEKKMTRLIDFGHAQDIKNARSFPATPDYQAPEISENHPHSKMSDAYCVGKTLEETCRKFHSVHAKIVQELVKKLQLDLSMRMSLQDAEEYLATIRDGEKSRKEYCKEESNLLDQLCSETPEVSHVGTKVNCDQQNIENGGQTITILQDCF